MPTGGYLITRSDHTKWATALTWSGVNLVSNRASSRANRNPAAVAFNHLGLTIFRLRHRHLLVWSSDLATTTSTPSRRSASSSDLSAFESVIRTSMSSRPRVCHMVSLPILVWSAKTNLLTPAAARARSDAATVTSGVVNPRPREMPLPDMNTLFTLSERKLSSVSGPTSARIERRSDPAVASTWMF